MNAAGSPTDPAAGASAEVARSCAPARVSEGNERPITVDQTNRSVVVDESVIVKWYRPPRPLPHHGSDVLAHLAEVGFEAMPEFLGTTIEDGDVVASVSAFLPRATDGWEWYLAEVHAWLDGDLDPSVLARRATELGSLAGRLHVSLATPSSRWPGPVGTTSVRSVHARLVALFERARALTVGETAAHLAGRWDRIRDALDTIAGPHGDDTTAAITVHGDLHVGNVLDAGDRLVVTDFDGNPIADDEARHQPAAVDVASLLQSIDHIGRIVDHRTAGARRADIAAFIEDSVGRALDAYRAELSGAGLDYLLDDRLLMPLRVAQELHELAYAAAHLPHWVYVPDATLTATFPDEPDAS